MIAKSRRVQVKITIDAELASSFKTACTTASTTITGELSQYMATFCGVVSKKMGYSPSLSTKRQRRARTKSLIWEIERLIANETRYLESIPANLQNSSAYDDSEQCIDILHEVVQLLESAY